MSVVAFPLQARPRMRTLRIYGGRLHLDRLATKQIRRCAYVLFDKPCSLLFKRLSILLFFFLILDINSLLQKSITLVHRYTSGVLVTAVLIVIRLMASYGAVYITMFMKRYISVADDRNPGKATPFIVGWAGMRGVVSLAAALSIPAMAGGEPFPHRDLILFITFVVILLTLVVQGLSLPLLIKSVKFPDFNDHMPNELARIKIKKALAQASLKFKKEKFVGDEHFLFQKLEEVWNFELESKNFEISDETRQRYFEILEEQRKALCELNKDPNVFISHRP